MSGDPDVAVLKEKIEQLNRMNVEEGRSLDKLDLKFDALDKKIDDHLYEANKLSIAGVDRFARIEERHLQLAQHVSDTKDAYDKTFKAIDNQFKAIEEQRKEDIKSARWRIGITIAASGVLATILAIFVSAVMNK